MLSKSICVRSPPHIGSGRARKYSSDLCRNFRIHSGSFLCCEIASTVSWERPFGDLKKYASASSGLEKPYWYSSRICLTTSVSVANGRHLRRERFVAFGLEPVGQLGT